jgi:sec-independent protein translocase protein TatB
MGLFEILLITVVTLLVVGPERMPEAVRSVALTIGRLKRMLSSAREEIEKQVGADDIRQQLHNEAVMDAIAKSEKMFDVNEPSSQQVESAEDKSMPSSLVKPESKIDPSENNSILNRNS